MPPGLRPLAVLPVRPLPRRPGVVLRPYERVAKKEEGFGTCRNVMELWEAAEQAVWNAKLVEDFIKAQVRLGGYPYHPVVEWLKATWVVTPEHITSDTLEMYLNILMSQGRPLTAVNYLTSQTFSAYMVPREATLHSLLTMVGNIYPKSASKTARKVYWHIQLTGGLWRYSTKLLITLGKYLKNDVALRETMKGLMVNEKSMQPVIVIDGVAGRAKGSNPLKVQRRCFGTAVNRIETIFNEVDVDVQWGLGALNYISQPSVAEESCEESPATYYKHKASLCHVLIRDLPPDTNRAAYLLRHIRTQLGTAPVEIRPFTHPALFYYTHRDYAIATFANGELARRYISQCDGSDPYKRGKRIKLAQLRARVNHVTERFGRRKARLVKEKKALPRWEKL
eukprot:TRINITY_DN29698_c0_g1_i1.p1 TRINITY_DN29698_c0_g1~~TRINITY_DN29698_c0_g1_i1.p1  ORF type:complete len:395 (+),score=50.74 TRINITY_DN29698_c0_g1_i1:48-1232(+)